MTSEVSGMAVSQNGWPALEPGSNKLYTWVIPARTGEIRVTLRNGSAGFLLVHFLLWYAETIEPLVGKIVDDWGYAYRVIRDGVALSNHAAGCAADHNATKHPLGVRGTFSRRERAQLALRLKLYRGCLRHGEFYQNRVDPMHVEINAPLAQVELRARILMNTPRGRRILKANPGQKAVILS